MKGNSNFFKRAKLSIGLASAMAIAFSANVSAEAGSYDIDIKSQDVGSALVKLSRASGVQIMLPQIANKELKVPALKGTYTLDNALQTLLAGTGLSHEFTDENVVLVTREDEQEGGESEKQDADEEIFVTGTRLKRNPAELSSNRIRFDRQAIEGSGSVTLEQFLRQMPQNVNGTTPVVFGSLNGATNDSGAATVNLRGLGSNSTLILVDGKRIGSNGLAGGVTDVTAIPLAIVESVEVLLEGASAVYGSDAMGGVININTRKDYESVDVFVDYRRPFAGGMNEKIFGIGGGFSWETGRFRADLTLTENTGLDAGARTLAVPDSSFNPGRFNTGPDFNASNAFGASDDAPMFYRSDSGSITVADYAALAPDDQADYTPVTEFVLPSDFNGDINSVDIFEAINYPAEVRGQNRALLPTRDNRSLRVSVEQDLSDSVTATVVASYADREVNFKQGNAALTGSTWSAVNPSNPFGVDVALNGWLENGAYPTIRDTEGKDLNIELGLNGSFGDSSWEWELSAGRSENSAETIRTNAMSFSAINAGLFSDGVSPSRGRFRSFEFGPGGGAVCEAAGGLAVQFTPVVWGCYDSLPPAEPLDPFSSDFSQFITPALRNSSENGESRFESLVRGDLMELPGGTVQLAAGASWRETELYSQAEIARTLDFARSPLETDSSREEKSVFLEGYAPLFSDQNALPGLQRLGMSFSVRWDDYDSPSTARAGDAGLLDPVLDLCDGDGAGSEECETTFSDTSYGFGINYVPVNDQLRFRLNWNTSFVAPQLNQLIEAPNVRTSNALRLNNPGAALPCPEHFTQQGDFCVALARIVNGGNPTLKPETGETLSIGVDFEPDFLPGFKGKLTWSELDSKDRIGSSRSSTFDSLDDLPDRITFSPEGFVPGVHYRLDNRAQNVSLLNREGIDLELFYRLDSDFGDFDFTVNYSQVLNYGVFATVSDETLTSINGSVTSGNGVAAPSLAPVPTHAANIQLGWSYGGVRVTLNGNAQSKTTITRFTGENYTVQANQAPTLFNMTMSYDFAQDTLFDAPAWLDGVLATVRINNLTNDFSTSTFENINPLAQPGVRTFDLRPEDTYARGRSFGINLRKTFD